MNKSDYDKYYKKGGTYVIPIEIFNELFDELERLNKARKTDIEYNKYLQKEIIRLNNIINELEKYINETKLEEFENAYGRRFGKTFTQAEVIICNMILNKLQELKGVDKE